MRFLHYQCSSGISGDMNLGAMVDLGVDPAQLEKELQKLSLDGWKLRFIKDERDGIHGTRCDVVLEISGHFGSEDNEHEHEHGDGRETGHEAGHEHYHGCRTLREIRKLVENSRLKEAVKTDALAVFTALAEAEGAVHGIPVEAVHFHEVGAVDSIIDIVGAAICWDLLEVDKITASAIELGGGTVQCAHGRMPVPAPATARLVENMMVSLGGTDKEATTPTGAALLVGKNCSFSSATTGLSIGTGTGIGQRKDPHIPNALQVLLLETEEHQEPGAETCDRDAVWELCANLDDMSPEKVSFLCQKLEETGALDVWQTAATFKKGRSGIVLSALVVEYRRAVLTECFFKHSTTLGIRRRLWNREKLERQIAEYDTSLGTVRVKFARFGGKVIRYKIEFEDCRRLADKHGKSLAEIESLVLRELKLEESTSVRTKKEVEE